VADKPILKIPVDTQEWDQFVDKFNAYQKVLETQGEQWADTNKGVKEVSKSFDQVEGSFDKLVKAAVNPAFADKSTGTFARFEKSSQKTAGFWKATERSLEKTSKYFETFVRSGIKWEGLAKGGGLIGGVLGIGGAILGATEKASNDFAGQNKLNRSLGLKPGEQQAFTNAFGPAGADDALLAKMAAAKNDPNQWHGLLAAGINQQEILSKNPEQLAAEFMEKAGDRFNKLGPNGGAWANSTGVSEFLDPNQLRLAGSYNHGQYQGFQGQYEQDVPKFAAQQSVLDEATKAKQDFDKAWTQLDLAFDKAAMKLTPDVVKLVDEFADMVSAFADSKEFATDVKDFKEDIHTMGVAAKWVADHLNHLFGLDKPGADKKTHVDPQGWGGKLLSFGKYTWDAITGNQFTPPKYDYGGDDDTSDANGGAPNGSAGYEDKMLDAIKMNESSGVNGKTNPDTGAAGLYGIMPENSTKAGIDPMDPVASRGLAKKIYDSFLTKYHGDSAKALAAYDGFGGLDKDIAKYGDQWRSHIDEYQSTGETIKYLKRIEKQGLNIGPGTNDADTKPSKLDTTPIDGMDVQPYTPEEEKAKDQSDKQYVKDQMKGNRNMFGVFQDLFTPGAGNKYLPPDNQSKATSGQQAPYNINVSVSAPPGTNTAVTAGGLAQ
jgi:hypothetical protein